jgi:hypothetical protein
MFATEKERGEAWETYRDELMAEYLSRPGVAGHRPDAWWEYEAERDEYVTEEPDWNFDGPLDEYAQEHQTWEMEPVVWMAEHGHLTDEEIALIAKEANEARPRIGTDAERKARAEYPDRRAVELHEAVQRALREKAT